MVLFTDLDGTLLCDDKTISEENQRAIKELLAGGGKLVLATGRAVEGVERYARQLSPEGTGCYIAAFNGALIYDCAAERVLFRRAVSVETVQELFDMAKAAGIYAQTFCDGKILVTCHAPELDYYRSKNPMGYVLAEHVGEYLGAHPECGSAAGPQKVVLISLDGQERLVKFQREHRRLEEAGRCGSVFSCPEYLEYCPWGISKGSAVEYLRAAVSQTEGVPEACRPAWSLPLNDNGCWEAGEPTLNDGGCRPAGEPTLNDGGCRSAGEPALNDGGCRSAGEPTLNDGGCRSAGEPTLNDGGCQSAGEPAADRRNASLPPLIVAVGDEENDLAMIRAADVGVAMRNGTAEVKRAADYVTEADNNQDAIAEVIRRFWSV